MTALAGSVDGSRDKGFRDVVGGLPARSSPERYDETRSGGLRMNRDAFLYRLPLLGRRASLDALDLPHSLPDDG